MSHFFHRIYLTNVFIYNLCIYTYTNCYSKYFLLIHWKAPCNVTEMPNTYKSIVIKVNIRKYLQNIRKLLYDNTVPLYIQQNNIRKASYSSQIIPRILCEAPVNNQSVTCMGHKHCWLGLNITKMT